MSDSNTGAVVVRQASREHAEAWLEMRVALWPDTSRREHEIVIGDHFIEDLGHPHVDYAFVAEDASGGAIGFLEIRMREEELQRTGPHRFRQYPYIEGWYVGDHARGRGVGRRLIEALEAWARTSGFEEIRSDAEVANTGSQRAHEALGFDEVERVVHYRKELGADDS